MPLSLKYGNDHRLILLLANTLSLISRPDFKYSDTRKPLLHDPTKSPSLISCILVKDDKQRGPLDPDPAGGCNRLFCKLFRYAGMESNGGLSALANGLNLLRN